MHNIIVYYVQLKYYSSNTFQPSLCYLHRVHISFVQDMDFLYLNPNLILQNLYITHN